MQVGVVEDRPGELQWAALGREDGSGRAVDGGAGQVSIAPLGEREGPDVEDGVSQIQPAGEIGRDNGLDGAGLKGGLREVRPAEVGTAQEGPHEVGASQLGGRASHGVFAGNVTIVQTGRLEDGAGEVGTGEGTALKLAAGQIEIAEIYAGQIAILAGIGRANKLPGRCDFDRRRTATDGRPTQTRCIFSNGLHLPAIVWIWKYDRRGLWAELDGGDGIVKRIVKGLKDSESRDIACEHPHAPPRNELIITRLKERGLSSD